MMFLGIDVGTTHCKAGFVRENGTIAGMASLPTVTRTTMDGNYYYEAEELWLTVISTIQSAWQACQIKDHVMSIGVASMSEAGILIDRHSGQPRCNFIPWYDLRTIPQHERIKQEIDPQSHFSRTGLHPSYKYGLAKLLWIQEHDPNALIAATWLSVADYIAYRLTGEMATDYTLAARTYCFDIVKRQWDQDSIRHFKLSEQLFPRVLPSGEPVGVIADDAFSEMGLLKGTSVSVSGHDHLCASIAVGANSPGVVFDSMGTAETLMGIIDEKTLSAAEYNSGLSYGRHVSGKHYYWLGGQPASGGSIEWVRNLLNDRKLTYVEIELLVQQAGTEPSEILFFPYISGSGAPVQNPNVFGAWIGLRQTHNRAQMIKSVFEGTAFEMESIYRAAKLSNSIITQPIIAVGGGTRNRTWMQIKANVSNLCFQIPKMDEATLIGAALLSAIGTTYFTGEQAFFPGKDENSYELIKPNHELNKRYRQIYEQHYLPLQLPLRAYYLKNI